MAFKSSQRLLNKSLMKVAFIYDKVDCNDVRQNFHQRVVVQSLLAPLKVYAAGGIDKFGPNIL